MKKAAPDQERLPDTANLDDADMAFWEKVFSQLFFYFRIQLFSWMFGSHSNTGIYHVMLRGINRQDLFHEESDYLFFLERLRLLAHPKNEKNEPASPLCDIYAYCLMTNHVHLMLAPRERELSDVVKPLAISYARYYNTKYSRCGYLFQDRFKSEPVDNLNYVVTLFRYIHQNPVKAGIVEAVEEHPWSSWHDYLSG